MQKAESSKQRIIQGVFVFFRVPCAFCLLVSAFCLLAFAQPGVPQPNSPLYGARPVPGQVATGLPRVLKNVGIDQKLNEQIPLD